MSIASRDICFSFLFQFLVDFDLHISSIDIFFVFNHLKALPRMSPNAWCPHSCNCKLSSFLLQVYITKGLELLLKLIFAVPSMSYLLLLLPLVNLETIQNHHSMYRLQQLKNQCWLSTTMAGAPCCRSNHHENHCTAILEARLATI